MGIVETMLGPRSQRNNSLPFTYEAWVDILNSQGREPVYDHFFSNTICGLIEHLEELDILPEGVQLYEVFRGRILQLSMDLFTDDDGSWITRPELCHVLEDYFERTGKEDYRGHVAKGSCSFEDRDRTGSGPVW